MIQKKKAVLTLICFILILSFVTGSGCITSSPGNRSSEPDNLSASITATPTHNATSSLTTAPVTVKTTRKPTTARTATIKTTKTQKNDILTVTLNSAIKQTRIGIDSTPAKGNIFLVLDLTILNNDQYNDFEYDDSSFVIIDKTNEYKRTAITSKFTSGLNNPLSSGKVIMQSKTSGQVVFSVTDNLAKNYRLNVVDSTGTLLTSLDTISAA